MRRKMIAWMLAAALAAAPGAALVSGAEFTSEVQSQETEDSLENTEDVTGEEDQIEEVDFDMPKEPVPDPVSPEYPDADGTELSEETDLFQAPEEESIFTDDEALFSEEAAANTSAVTITSCKGYSRGEVRITAKVPGAIASKDSYYYLFQVNPVSGALVKKIARQSKPSGPEGTITFRLKTEGHPEYVMMKYAVAVKSKAGSSNSSYTKVSGMSYVSYPEKTAAYTAAYKLPKTKKGLQTTDISQLKSTKSKTAFANLYASTLLTRNAESVAYKYNGTTYYFNKVGGYTNYVRQCNQNGIQVTMQIMLDYSPVTADLLASGGPRAGTALYAWNITNRKSREKMEALFSFIADLFGRNDCYVSNWVLGNEVNASNIYYYPGNVSKTKFIENYSETYRSLYNAVRGRRASSKVFICLDHNWNVAVNGYSSRNVLDSFASKIKTLQGGVNWNLAYHAYPFPLTDPRFWSGNYSYMTTNHSDSPVISLNNLSVLTNYVKVNYGSKTRIILSEQGFTSTKGQDAQAAGLALGYYIAACNPMVDAFHIRSYTDESHETAQGLAFGIKGKKAYKVFTNMDASSTLTYTQNYLKKQVGSKWTSKIPYYNKKRLYTMYRSA